jgi:sulfite reductase (NADPH) flavoprotein alpha-component
MKAWYRVNASRVAWVLAFASAALAWWSPPRFVSALLVLFAYLSACAGIVVHNRRHARGNVSPADDAILIAYASQTGFAEELARRSRACLEAGGARVHVAALGALTVDDIASHTHALFIVSTTGEGEAPDHAAPFVRKAMGVQSTRCVAPRLAALRFGVLALGDRHYPDYCAFGRRLSVWLSDQHAQSMFDTIEVDNGDAAALRCWQAQLSALFDGVAQGQTETSRDTAWTLETRALLNAGSVGEGAYHLGLLPPSAAALDWQAGDIAEIQPRHLPSTVQRWLEARGLDGSVLVQNEGEAASFADVLATRQLLDDETPARTPQAWIDALAPLARRSYSIASLPEDGRLELLVRQTRWAEAAVPGVLRLGLASGWLTEHAKEGDTITLRVRKNRGFHAPVDDRPLILVGNGTGLAGLRAHLKLRALAGQARNWLIFGERNAAYDAFYHDEIERWRTDGHLERVDRVWSRDGGELRYVQDALLFARESILHWVEDGASIYVCGSLKGMAPGVHRALMDLLGQARLEALALDGRYRRDVY